MTTENMILYNMMNQGSVKKESTNSHIVTEDKNYRIEFKRTEVGFFDVGETNFKCQLIFKNNTTGDVICTVEGSEMDVLILLDCMSFYECSMMDGRTSSWPTTPSGTFYFFQIEPIDNLLNATKIAFKVLEYNPLLEQTAIRVSLTLTLDEYQKFMDTMYFCFLIDTPFGGQLKTPPEI